MGVVKLNDKLIAIKENHIFKTTMFDDFPRINFVEKKAKPITKNTIYYFTIG